VLFFIALAALHGDCCHRCGADEEELIDRDAALKYSDNTQKRLDFAGWVFAGLLDTHFRILTAPYIKPKPP
jgi:hypothetical protein